MPDNNPTPESKYYCNEHRKGGIKSKTVTLKPCEICGKTPTKAGDPNPTPQETIWTTEKAIEFARDLINHDELKYRDIGKNLLGLKDDSLVNACKIVELLLNNRQND